MSKVVKGIGRAISGVVKGVVNVVKDVAKSKLGKILITAAAVYFGGAALSGAFGGATTAAGTVATGLEGATAAIGNAWTSLGTAATQAAGAVTGAEGASFANAGNALSTGFGGSAATMGSEGLISNAVAPSAASLPVQSGGRAMANGLPFNPSDAQVTNYIQNAAGNSSLTSPPSSFMGNMMSSPYAAPAAIMSGTQLIGGAMQGYGAQQEAKRQEKMSADARTRYNANVGTRLFS